MYIEKLNYSCVSKNHTSSITELHQFTTFTDYFWYEQTLLSILD